MMENPKPLTAIQHTDGAVLFAIMKLLADNGDQMTATEIHDELPSRHPFSNSDKAPYNTWPVKWWSTMHMIGIEYKYAGFIHYAKSLWTLTDKGKEAVRNSNSDAVRRQVLNLWRKKSSKPKDEEPAEEPASDNQDIKAQAANEIQQYLRKLNPYAFQDLVAALFRAMGYQTPYIAKKGADHGIDIVLHQDPLGVNVPRIKVQVKHYPEGKVAADVIQRLVGTLHHSEDVGIVVTSGSFTTQAKFEARDTHKPIRIIDGDELIFLWKEYYSRMPEEDKKLLPIEPIYFLKHEENE